ncbi:chaplin family protein [Streptomyces lateritius]|uniref:Chaplin family protein n=1 Tax=Streptomyces lateritius TaxID=67313 RepID=A0ABW6YFF7_9ACTN
MTCKKAAVVVAGNVVQVPIDAPVNPCGNSVGIIRLLSPAGGDARGNF